MVQHRSCLPLGFYHSQEHFMQYKLDQSLMWDESHNSADILKISAAFEENQCQVKYYMKHIGKFQKFFSVSTPK